MMCTFILTYIYIFIYAHILALVDAIMFRMGVVMWTMWTLVLSRGAKVDGEGDTRMLTTIMTTLVMKAMTMSYRQDSRHIC